MPRNSHLKKNLWDNLLNLMKSRPGNWVLFGDFNAVRRPNERFNSKICPIVAATFNKFIADAGLLDLNMGGKRFTYFCDDGYKLSKLDRFLVYPNLLTSFPSAYVTTLPREYSDHSPINLRTELLDFGSHPFRFFNSWLFKDDFERIVIHAWSNFAGDGAPDRYLSEKLHFVKNVIKEWKWNDSEKDNQELNNIRKRMNVLDALAEDRQLNQTEISEWRKNKQRLMELEKF